MEEEAYEEAEEEEEEDEVEVQVRLETSSGPGQWETGVRGDGGGRLSLVFTTGTLSFCCL